jgi:hypothetical protein
MHSGIIGHGYKELEVLKKRIELLKVSFFAQKGLSSASYYQHPIVLRERSVSICTCEPVKPSKAQ